MMKKIKLILVFVIGILLGSTIHGFLEILSIFILLTWLRDVFFGISLNMWIQIDLISFVVIEILTIIGVLLIYRKYEK